MKILNRIKGAVLAATLAIASFISAFAPPSLPVASSVAAVSLAAASSAHAASMTDFLETALINHLFRGTAYTAPSNWYVRLNTTSCSDSASGTEVTGGSYARVAVASGTGNWAATSSGNGTTSNVNAVNFTTPSAGWGTVVSFELMDASSGGNSLICNALTVNKTINSGDTVTFPAGSLSFQIDN